MIKGYVLLIIVITVSAVAVAAVNINPPSKDNASIALSEDDALIEEPRDDVSIRPSEDEALTEQSKNDASVKTLVVITKNFGKDVLLVSEAETPLGSSAMDALRQVAEIETAYGGGFVVSINGLRSTYSGGQGSKQDWLYYINGILANVGAAAYWIRDGEIQQWDFHYWGTQTFVTATVGCFPEPFLHGYSGKIYPTLIVYDDDLMEDALRLKDELIDLGVKDVAIVSADELTEADKRGSNLIILGTMNLPLLAELNSIYDRIGFQVYFEDGKLNVLNTDREIAGTYLSGCVIQAAQNPWNPKGTLASENVVWMIAGLDETDVEEGIDILIENNDELRYAFSVVIAEDSIYRVP